MPNVKVKEKEPFEVALRRFKRSCEKAGIVTELRRRVLRKTDPRAQAQESRRRQTLGQARLPRDGKARSSLLTAATGRDRHQVMD